MPSDAPRHVLPIRARHNVLPLEDRVAELANPDTAGFESIAPGFDN